MMKNQKGRSKNIMNEHDKPKMGENERYSTMSTDNGKYYHQQQEATGNNRLHKNSIRASEHQSIRASTPVRTRRATRQAHRDMVRFDFNEPAPGFPTGMRDFTGFDHGTIMNMRPPNWDMPRMSMPDMRMPELPTFDTMAYGRKKRRRNVDTYDPVGLPPGFDRVPW